MLVVNKGGHSRRIPMKLVLFVCVQPITLPVIDRCNPLPLSRSARIKVMGDGHDDESI
jgi:hypothetical protein